MTQSKNQIDTSKFMMTTRLLAEEALRKGYSLTAMASRPSSKSYTIRCEKDGKELYFKSLYTSLTPSYGVFIADDKVLTRSVLAEHDVAMPDTLIAMVDDQAEVAIDSDMRAFLNRHKRLVVKPAATNHGQGVTVDVRTEDELREALQFARREGGEPDIIVQQMVFGREYRFLVLHNKVLAVAYRRPAFVVGDGVSTVRALIEQKNLDPRRGDGHAAALTKINLNEVASIHSPEFLETIPAADSEVEVLKTSNLSRGGESVDVTDQVSSALKKMAARAAQVCSLGVAGVDIITQDIEGDGSDSYVLEVNVSPGIRMHQFPSVGTARNVAKELFAAIEKTAHPVGKKLKMIGRAERVKLLGLTEESFHARIDTGATVSSLWASDIRTEEDGLYCKLFGEGHPLYTGQDIHFSEYSTRLVRSSNGHEEMRYQVTVTLVIKGKKIKTTVTLADRSGQIYPMLVGRNVLRNKFIVHVAEGRTDTKQEKVRKQMNTGVKMKAE